MREIDIETNPNYTRAMFLLHEKFQSPADLYKYWRAMGSYQIQIPVIEKRFPWWRDLPMP